jgi:hypothetical protein
LGEIELDGRGGVDDPSARIFGTYAMMRFIVQPPQRRVDPGVVDAAGTPQRRRKWWRNVWPRAVCCVLCVRHMHPLPPIKTA